MLQPKRTKHTKAFKGRIKGNASNSNALDFGDYGLKAIDAGRLTSRQIEACRKVLVRVMKRSGSVYFRHFPSIPVSAKPADVRMGKGKGSIDRWVVRIKPGHILFELSGVKEDVAQKAFKLANDKLAIKCKIVKRIEGN